MTAVVPEVRTDASLLSTSVMVYALQRGRQTARTHVVGATNQNVFAIANTGQGRGCESGSIYPNSVRYEPLQSGRTDSIEADSIKLYSIESIQPKRPNRTD